MKSGVIGFGILLLILGLLAPGLIGLWASARNEAVLSQMAERDETDAELTVESFERGWFSSTARYRIEFRDDRFRRAAQMALPGAQADPTLILDSRIRHGPFVGESLIPVLARVDSTITLAGLSEQPIRVPGKLATVFWLTGGGTTLLDLEPNRWSLTEAEQIDWQGGELRVDFDGSGEAFEFKGAASPVTIEGPDAVVRLGSTTMSGAQRLSAFGFWTGSVDLGLDGLEATGPDGQSLVLGGVSVSSETAVDGDRFAGYTSLDLESFRGPHGEGSASLRVNVKGLDAAAVGALQDHLEQLGASAESEDPALTDELTTHLQTLGARGGSCELEELRVQTSAGGFELEARFNLPENTLADVESPRAWLLAIEGDASIKFDQSLLALAAMANPQVGQYAEAMVTGGFLRPAGDRYELDASYQGGLVKINDNAPMPVPMPQ